MADKVDVVIIGGGIAGNQSHQDLHPFFPRQWIFHIDGGKTVIEPLHMFFKPEDLPSVHQKHLIDPVAKGKSAVEHRYAGLFQRNILPVQINNRGPATVFRKALVDHR